MRRTAQAAVQLVWNNPHPAPHERVSANVLRRLSDILIGCVQRGEWQAARQLISLYALSPFAIALVASRMSQAGIPEDAVLKLI